MSESEDYGLCQTTQQFFCDACEFYELQPDEKRTLLLACIAYDRAEAARQVLAEKGMTYEDRFGQPRSRPEVAIERDSRLAYLRCIRALGLREMEETIARNAKLRSRPMAENEFANFVEDENPLAELGITD